MIRGTGLCHGRPTSRRNDIESLASGGALQGKESVPEIDTAVSAVHAGGLGVAASEGGEGGEHGIHLGQL